MGRGARPLRLPPRLVVAAAAVGRPTTALEAGVVEERLAVLVGPLVHYWAEVDSGVGVQVEGRVGEVRLPVYIETCWPPLERC